MKKLLRTAAFFTGFLLILSIAAPLSALAVSVETSIVFSGSSASINGNGASFKKGTLTIRETGSYTLSGTLEEGRIVVEAPENAEVELILMGLSAIHSEKTVLNIKQAGHAILTMGSGTKNLLTGPERASDSTDEETESIPAVLRSACPLTVRGEGELTVNAPGDQGIKCEDLLFEGGLIRVLSSGDGIRAKGDLTILSSDLTLECGENGIHCGKKASEEEDGTPLEATGSFILQGGTISVTCGLDAVQTGADILIESGSITAHTGNGSESAVAKAGSDPFASIYSKNSDSSTDEPSRKGLKAEGGITVKDGSFFLDTEDDALHCAQELLISGGEMQLLSGDDAIHSDTRLTISGGSIDIKKSVEGIEAPDVLISGGDITVCASDDGINANGGENGSAFEGDRGRFGSRSGAFGGDSGSFRDFSGDRGRGPGTSDMPFGKEGSLPGTAPAVSEAPENEDTDQPPALPENDPFFMERENRSLPPDMNDENPENPPSPPDNDSLPPSMFAESGQPVPPENESLALPTLTISGGSIHIIADGDGLDSNGDLLVTGGTVIVDGPVNGANGALDSGSENGGSLIVTGGTVLAMGASGMTECFGKGSLQASIDLNAPYEAGTELSFFGSDGSLLFSCIPEKRGQSIIFTCPSLQEGSEVTVNVGTQQYTVSAFLEHEASGFGRMRRGSPMFQ